MDRERPDLARNCTSARRSERHSVVLKAMRGVLNYLGYLQESRTPSIDCFNCLLGAEHDYLSLCGQFYQDIRKVLKVRDASAENLIAPALADVVAHQRGSAASR